MNTLDENRNPILPAIEDDPISRPPCASDELESPPEPPIRTAMHDITLLPGMEPMLRTIERDMEQARRRVSVETYIYRDDKLGRRFGDALAHAVQRGVPARLLYDPLGSEKTNPAFFDELRSRGIDVRPYRPADFTSGSKWPRDHGRVIVIDECAYTGGAAWGDEWLPREHGGLGWHDVCLRVVGPCVQDFAHLFEQRWREASYEIGNPLDFATDNKYPDLELVGDTPNERNLVYSRHREAIHRAKRRIWMEIAYFFPPAPLLKDLYDATARGVDVRVILPGETDLPILKRAAQAEFREWINGGLRIFEYEPAWCTRSSRSSTTTGAPSARSTRT